MNDTGALGGWWSAPHPSPFTQHVPVVQEASPEEYLELLTNCFEVRRTLGSECTVECIHLVGIRLANVLH